MYSLEDKICRQLDREGRGWCFSGKDFTTIGGRVAIDVVLHRLEKSGSIRRIIRGLYDYPEHSNLLKRQLSPNINHAAHALARKFRWKIQPTGAAALNYFGLSTQVPGRLTYLTDGPKRSYDIMGTTLESNNVGLKESKLKHPQSELVVQALKSLGPERVDAQAIAMLRERLTVPERKRILHDTRYITGWIYGIIKKICREEELHG